MMMEIVDNFFFVSFFDRIEQKIKYLNTEKVGRTWYDNSVGVGDDAREANARTNTSAAIAHPTHCHDMPLLVFGMRRHDE